MGFSRQKKKYSHKSEDYFFYHRFIAERGDGGQLRHVENIDEAFHLKPMPPVMGEKKSVQTLDIARPLPVTNNTPR